MSVFLRKLPGVLGRRAPEFRGAIQFTGARPSVGDLAGLDIDAPDPPTSKWLFHRLRHLGIAQVDDFFARVEPEEPMGNPWNAAYWVLPLVTVRNGMVPFSVWRGGNLDGLGFSLCHPHGPRPRAYRPAQVDGMLHAISCFVDLLGQLKQGYCLRVDGNPVQRFSDLAQTVRERFSDHLR